ELHKFSHTRRDGKVCLPGCYPADYREVHAYSATNCDIYVRANLQTYFVTLVAIELAMLVLPIILSYWEILKEYRKSAADSEQGVRYSMLQWEAKKYPYTFNSFGGDKINDYLDIAIAYSVIAMWGCISPIMATFATVALMASFRLRVYRMLYVTQRPLPRAAAGLGVWRNIFNWINVVAVATNVGLGCVFFYPGNVRPVWVQLAVFLAAEHVVLLLQATVQAVIPE
ncbi:unnamed protein product, partial [Effrenium voratum]